jgi:hypothetical protein
MDNENELMVTTLYSNNQCIHASPNRPNFEPLIQSMKAHSIITDNNKKFVMFIDKNKNKYKKHRDHNETASILYFSIFKKMNDIFGDVFCFYLKDNNEGINYDNLDTLPIDDLKIHLNKVSTSNFTQSEIPFEQTKEGVELLKILKNQVEENGISKTLDSLLSDAKDAIDILQNLENTHI